jgi:hypothetical protein
MFEFDPVTSVVEVDHQVDLLPTFDADLTIDTLDVTMSLHLVENCYPLRFQPPLGLKLVLAEALDPIDMFSEVLS